jgi:hypothetical protein
MSVDPAKLDVTLWLTQMNATCHWERRYPQNTSEQIMFRAKPILTKQRYGHFDIDTDGTFRARYPVWDNIPLKLHAMVTVVTTLRTFHNSFFKATKTLWCPFRDACWISSINVNIDGKNFQTADVSTIMESICHYYSLRS